MARRAGAARGSPESGASNRGGVAGGGGGGETCEAGHAEEQVGEKGGGPGRAVYGAASGGGLGGVVCRGVCMSVQELSYCLCLPCCCTVLLQHGADPNIRNTDGKSALDLAEPSAKAVLAGQCPSVSVKLYAFVLLCVFVYIQRLLPFSLRDSSTSI